MELPKRKSNRLKNYDYSQNGAYFITICTHDNKCLFVGDDSISSRTIDDIWNKTINEYKNIECPKYVIMPNHFHAIIIIKQANIEFAPTIPQIMQSFKRYSTIEYIKLVKKNLLKPFDKKIWQRSYYDHVIRSEEEYQKIWKYIDENLLKWELDCYHVK